MAGREMTGRGGGGIAEAKRVLRRRVLARRREVDPERRHLLDAALLEQLCALVDELSVAGRDVLAFVPSGGEAGGPGLPAALVACGARVWLPVSPASGPLSWARFVDDADLRQGRFGIPVPGGPVRGPEVAADAALVVVPAVAVDRSGARLGRGGGYYDRSLTGVPSGVPLWTPLDDEDVVDEVPAEEHDVRVDGVVTPTGRQRFADWHSRE